MRMLSSQSLLSIYTPLLITGNFLIPTIHSWTHPERKTSLRVLSFCNSNATHISWVTLSPDSKGDDGTDNPPPATLSCAIQTRSEAEKECMDYLYSNIMPFDIPKAESLGFVQTDQNSSLPDGLWNGVVTSTIQYALDAKTTYPWTNGIPKDVYLEYVLPHASVDEARTNWRQLISEALAPIITPLLSKKDISIREVVHAVNKNVWDVLGGITFKAGQTPLIYDPMSTIAFKYASCTGVSILFVAALRSVGIPARLAGTPAWNGQIENGNHSWVEVWCDGRWMFMESAPAAGHVPGVFFDPCDFWFCNPTKFDGKTKVFAARYSKDKAGGVFFPMSWNEGSEGVPGEDRSEWMNQICSKCGKSEA